MATWGTCETGDKRGRTLPCWNTPTHEYVVPRSMPMAGMVKGSWGFTVKVSEQRGERVGCGAVERCG